MSLLSGALLGRSAEAQSSNTATTALGPQQGRLHAGIQYSASFNSRIYEAHGGVLSAHYSLVDRLRLGVVGGYWSNSEANLAAAIRGQGVEITGGGPLGSFGSPYELTWLLTADLQFTPAYAQLRLTDDFVASFDIYVPLAAGVAQMRRPIFVGADFSGEFDKKLTPTFNFGLGLRTHIATWLALTVEFRDHLFIEPSEESNGVRTRPHMQVGLQFSLGGEAQFPLVPRPRSWEKSVVAGTVEVGTQFGATFFDGLTRAFSPSLSVAYHLSDAWAFEVFGTKVFSGETKLKKDIINNFSFANRNEGRIDEIQLLWAAGATAQFSPFAGRLDVFGRTLSASPYLTLGFGVGQTRVGCSAGMALDPNAFPDNPTCPLIPVDAEAGTIVYEPNTTRGFGIVGAGVRLRLSDLFALRVEVKDYVYTARIFRPEVNERDQLQTGVRHHVFSQIGLSLFFGG